MHQGRGFAHGKIPWRIGGIRLFDGCGGGAVVEGQQRKAQMWGFLPVIRGISSVVNVDKLEFVIGF
jgi:hypothetical protein